MTFRFILFRILIVINWWLLLLDSAGGINRRNITARVAEACVLQRTRAGSSMRLVRLKPQGAGSGLPGTTKIYKVGPPGPEISREKEDNGKIELKYGRYCKYMYQGPAVAFMPQGPEGP